MRVATSCEVMILSMRARSTLRIFPLSGRIAWFLRSRPCLAEPPAESPSTRKTSFLVMSWDSQSVSLPGRTATPLPRRFSTTLPAFCRAVAALIASCAIFFPSSTFWFNHASSGSFTREAMSFTASREDRRSLVWPWNWGSRSRAEST
jgi:hypothetical protein